MNKLLAIICSIIYSWSLTSSAPIFLHYYDSNYNIKTVIAESRSLFKYNKVIADLAASQAILESNLYGRPSKLAYYDNNLFGIKGEGTAGSTWYQTRECFKKCINVDAKFAKNSTLKDSFKQYADVIERNRYYNLWNAKTFEEAARLIKKDGYATDPTYSKQLIQVYNKYVKNS